MTISKEEKDKKKDKYCKCIHQASFQFLFYFKVAVNADGGHTKNIISSSVTDEYYLEPVVAVKTE